MARTITIHAGDYEEGKALLKGDKIVLPAKKGPGLLIKDTVYLTQLKEIAIATDESVKRIGGTVGWAAAGAIALGPVGLLAGLLLGGKKKEITFVARFEDDKKILATTDAKTYKMLAAAAF